MQQQQRVASFVRQHDLEAPPAYRALDIVSELGELAKEANKSTSYGHSPKDIEVSSDEIGDLLFSILALAEAMEIDADDALDEALAKYERRIAEKGTAGSETPT